MIEEPNGMISVPGLGLAIPLAALYPQARSG
jgi:hypothetical protein